MSHSADPLVVLEHIRQLESELAELWRSLSGTSESLPESSLLALEISVAGHPFLVPITPVREVVAMAWPEPIPEAPAWVAGSIPYGCQSVPVVDLGLRLSGQPTTISPQLVVVITDTPQWLGLLVSGVGQVRALDPAALSSAGPEIPHAPFVLGVTRDDTGDALHLLSVARLGRALAA